MQFTVINMKELMTDPQTSACGRVYYKTQFTIVIFKRPEFQIQSIGDCCHGDLSSQYAFNKDL